MASTKYADVFAELGFEQAHDRCMAWKPAMTEELHELANIVASAYEDDDLESVEELCEALLTHDELPAMYRAQMHTYLSSCEGYDSWSHIVVAEAAIKQARSDIVSTCLT